ncbi:MAG TPA: hypothetical protein VJM12_19780 [Pyrinomonadaceae bacterium]|nr:hypothetical protein [Pyrinomonadaceae bacterium]
MFRTLLVIVSCLIFFTCTNNHRAIDASVFQVFRGFDLVGLGAAKLETDGSIDTTFVPPHEQTKMQLPKTVEIRTGYVFHYASGRPNNERLAAEELPERLRKLGFKIVQAPNYNGGQFSYPYIGGPLFSIVFEDGNHKGIIFNRVEGEVRDKDWIVEDYVLVFLS